MKVKHVVQLAELVQQRPALSLPPSLLQKHIEVSNPDALKQDEFVLHFDDKTQMLELKYMEPDDCLHDYWSDHELGELVDVHTARIDEIIESLNEKKYPYFLIATYEHGLVKHYPLLPGNDFSTCRWDTGIRSIFVPSERFIKESESNPGAMLEQLEGYFEEYSEWCNGNVYVLCQDIYKTGQDDAILPIFDRDAVGGFIGHGHAAECLRNDCY